MRRMDNCNYEHDLGNTYYLLSIHSPDGEMNNEIFSEGCSLRTSTLVDTFIGCNIGEEKACYGGPVCLYIHYFIMAHSLGLPH